MKKKGFITAVLSVCAVVFSCNNGMNSASGTRSDGVNERSDRRQRTAIDSANYVDFTSKSVNAAGFTKQDILYELNGTFRLAGGNSYITIDRSDGTVTISSDEARFDGSGGRNMYAKYSFEVQAANENCLYIKMGNKRNAQFIIDYDVMVNQEVPDLIVCIPLYGYSRNRIEVSPVMEGYIAMPSGTYWADKK